MSKSLANLIYIDLLRAFKNKTDSAYVQTGAVDQTVAGTKTFSKPIVGSVTGSSGSCTGNAATATRADSAAKADTATNANYANSAGSATNATNATNAGYTNWLRTSSHTDHLFHTEWDGTYFWTYVTAGDGGYRAVRVERSNSSGYADSAGSANSVAASAIRAQWYAAFPDGAEAHNAMWGGRDITAAFNNGTVSANIANGTFKDIFPGDYITKQVTISGTTYNVNWVVADCDYWINKGDHSVPPHHVVIVPQVPIFNANMNATNTTEGGYAGSRMYRETIPACATGIVNAFGADHILTFRDLIVNNINASGISLGNSSWLGVSAFGSGQWVDAQCNLIGEHMVYGHSVWSSGGENQMIQTRQFSAFRLSERLINYNRQNWWLRDVVSSAGFACVDGFGDASAFNAFDVDGVRPFALLR